MLKLFTIRDSFSGRDVYPFTFIVPIIVLIIINLVVNGVM